MENRYNETNHKLTPVKVDAVHVRDLRERLKRAQTAYRVRVRRMTPRECPRCGRQHCS